MKTLEVTFRTIDGSDRPFKKVIIGQLFVLKELEQMNYPPICIKTGETTYCQLKEIARSGFNAGQTNLDNYPDWNPDCLLVY